MVHATNATNATLCHMWLDGPHTVHATNATNPLGGVAVVARCGCGSWAYKKGKMLVAHQKEGGPVEAFSAEKGNAFVCPGCKESVILKKGHVVVHHFAHYPDSRCAFGTGETFAHLKAKSDMAISLRNRGWRTEVEYVPPDNPGRRIDVITWPPHLRRGLVFEFQHTPIDPETIFKRADDYAELGYAQVWIFGNLI